MAFMYTRASIKLMECAATICAENFFEIETNDGVRENSRSGKYDDKREFKSNSVAAIGVRNGC